MQAKNRTNPVLKRKSQKKNQCRPHESAELPDLEVSKPGTREIFFRNPFSKDLPLNCILGGYKNCNNREYDTPE